MKEIWKDIKGYEGVYRISNHGNVYSHYTDELVRSHVSFDKKGNPFRLRVKLCKFGGKSMKMVHRLVYEAFSGEIKGQLDFKDGDFNNCKINNLIDVNYTHKQKTLKNKRIIDMSTMKVYESVIQLAKELNITTSSLRAGMKRKSSKYSKYKRL